MAGQRDGRLWRSRRRIASTSSSTVDYQKDEALRAHRPRLSVGPPTSPAEASTALSSQHLPRQHFRPAARTYRSDAALESHLCGRLRTAELPSAYLGPDRRRAFFDFASVIDTIPPVERTSVVGARHLAIDRGSSDLRRSRLRYQPVHLFASSPTRYPSDFECRFGYPAGGPYYPTAFAAGQRRSPAT